MKPLGKQLLIKMQMIVKLAQRLSYLAQAGRVFYSMKHLDMVLKETLIEKKLPLIVVYLGRKLPLQNVRLLMTELFLKEEVHYLSMMKEIKHKEQFL